MVVKNYSPSFFKTVYCVILLVTLQFAMAVDAFADGDVLPDTVRVEEVIISSGNISRFQAGAKIEKISQVQFQSLNTGNLEQLLLRTSPIAVKSTAGGLSTIRFRGTSPDHTSVNFGGLNINSLTLGHSNMSNVPLFLFDEIGIQFGSSSSVNGSGNIGGAIHLGLKNYWVDGFKAELTLSSGSFGEQLYGAKIFAGNGKFESVTRAYYYYKTNDFKFMNTSYRNFENGVFEIEDVQQNANINNQGVIQEINYRFSAKETIKTMIWLEKDWHLIQQNMAANIGTPDFKESLEDESLRIWSAYENKKHDVKYHIGGGYVYDNNIFDNSTESIKTQRYIGEANAETDFNWRAGMKVGFKLSHIAPNVYAYSNGAGDESRADLFFSYRQQFTNKLRVTLNLRQGFVSGYDVPFTPSLGLAYLVVSKEHYLINVTGNIARNYRVPTFNDRYWVPGGNPNLRPEQGVNYEIGSKYHFDYNQIKGHFSLNAFYMDVENWLLWIQGNNGWEAQNVQRVKSKGIELSSSAQKTIGNVELTSGFNYAYTSTQRVESENGSDPLGRQLEYVPLHTGSIYASFKYKKLVLGVDGRYTHWQYSDGTNKNILDEYFLLNLTAHYDFKLLNGQGLQINAAINNVLNKNYQSTYGYAMPRINYRIGVRYRFN